LASIAEDYDYRAEFSLASCRSHGSYDVFLRRLDAGDGSTNTAVAWPHPETIAEDLALHVHDPSQLARRQMLIRQLRDHLKATLPESMLPAELVLVHELSNNMPLTSDTRW
jgi:hypothetical protein